MANIEADPLVANDPRNEGARLRVISALVTVAAADADGTIYAICQVQSGWSIKSILVANSAMSGSTDWNLGLYTKGTSTAVDDNCYADAVTMATIVPSATPTQALPGMRDLRYAVAATTSAAVNNKVWEDAGATEDPNLTYDLCFTAVDIGAVDGTVAVNVLYTDGS